MCLPYNRKTGAQHQAAMAADRGAAWDPVATAAVPPNAVEQHSFADYTAFGLSCRILSLASYLGYDRLL